MKLKDLMFFYYDNDYSLSMLAKQNIDALLEEWKNFLHDAHLCLLTDVNFDARNMALTPESLKVLATGSITVSGFKEFAGSRNATVEGFLRLADSYPDEVWRYFRNNREQEVCNDFKVFVCAAVIARFQWPYMSNLAELAEDMVGDFSDVLYELMVRCPEYEHLYCWMYRRLPYCSEELFSKVSEAVWKYWQGKPAAGDVKLMLKLCAPKYTEIKSEVKMLLLVLVFLVALVVFVIPELELLPPFYWEGCMIIVFGGMAVWLLNVFRK